MSIRDVLRSEEIISAGSGGVGAAMNKATTLEAHHQSRIRGLDSERERITDLQRELQEKKVAVNNVGSHTDEWRNLNDQIDELQRRIVSLKNDDDRLNYFLDVGDMLFQYFEAQESVAKGHMPRRGGTAVNLPANSVLSYFASEAPVSGSSSASYTTDKYAATEETSKIRKINVEEGMNRDKMLEKYLAVVDPAEIKSGIMPGSGIEPGWGTCRSCGIEMTFYQNEAILGCPRCGHEEFMLIDSEKPSYKDPPREITYFAYKKINHFNEWLAQFQAKENTDIPQEVVESVMRELKKERISDPKKLKKEKILEILRKLKFSKMYDHVQQIKNRIQHQMTNLTLSKEMEEKLQHMFREIQPAFIKYCPASRSNFLSYPYVLFKLCQLLEMDDYLPFFQLLKSREKLYQQDQVWQKICAEMRWQFIKSI
uniref:Viral late gene transcription factor 3 zinc ribbon domain-containing protein n=1 Tax=viral metagenome TaxID=1070528 RepID=A0A6C0DBA8_9ZZZZ